MLAIRYSEARIGDGVTDGQETLRAIQFITPLGHRIVLSGFSSTGKKVEFIGFPYALLGLVSRPWQGRITMLDSLDEIARLGMLVQRGQHKRVETLTAYICELRKACEEYELAVQPQ